MLESAISRPLPAAFGLDAVGALVAEFLARSNANTVRAYSDALHDFAKFAERPREEALCRLLRGGFQDANKWVSRYKTSMVGVRGKGGKLERGRGLSASAVNLRLVVLRSLVKKARRAGLIQWEIDVANIDDERVHDVRGPGMEILNKMLEVAKARPGAEGARDYAILRLAGELGLRRKEISALDLGDFDGAGQEIRVHGKGRQQKVSLSCTPRTADAIERWLEWRPRPLSESPLFTNLIPGRTGRISGPAIYLIVRSLGKAALPLTSPRKISPHKIRHTAITQAVKETRGQGLAREEVKKFSRHRDPRMIDRYLDADDRAQALLAKAVGDKLA